MSVVAAAAGQAIIASKSPTVRNKNGELVTFLIDGRWGSTTQRAYADLKVGDRMAVDAVVAAAGTTVNALTTAWNKQRWAGNDLAVRTAGAEVKLTDLTAELVRQLQLRGVSDYQHLAVLASPKLLELEAGIRAGSVSPVVVNPTTSASGPFQYILGTWNAYSRGVAGAKQYKDRAAIQAATVRAEPGSPGDWRVATAVHANALVDTLNLLKRNGVPITVGTMYTIHNQGAPTGLSYLKGKIGFSKLTNLAGQSPAARDLIARAV